MKESQTPLNVIIRLVIVAAAVNCVLPDLSHARPRPVVEVRIKPVYYVAPVDTICRQQLTYHIPEKFSTGPATISIPHGVRYGAGLLVEHVAPDGTVSTQSLPPEPWWFSNFQTLPIESSILPIDFSLPVVPGNLDFSQLGIYHISYVHPLPETEEDPNSPVFVSNTLTIARVTQQRYDRLYKILREDTELALASYMFRNPPAAAEYPQYRRGVGPIDEAITPGVRQDEVLLLLGSPDMIQHTAPSEQEYCDEKWFYETSPVGGYYVYFKDGSVVQKGHYADWAGD
ncbi:MAG TPA: hypothetical protein VMX13_08730 [Sedimentisphaerales bacterium]|nr:hypothetical protein [Sedimentisphaerales bacterium]